MRTAHQQYCLDYYQENKETLKLKRKLHRQENPELYKAKDARYYEKHKEEISVVKKRNRNYSLSYRLSAILANSKSRAAKQGYAFNIDKEFLVELWNKQEGKCALTKEPLSLEQEKCRWTGNLVSLDRIDSLGGYTKDNVQFVTSSVNYAKGSLTIEQFVELCKKVIDNA